MSDSSSWGPLRPAPTDPSAGGPSERQPERGAEAPAEDLAGLRAAREAIDSELGRVEEKISRIRRRHEERERDLRERLEETRTALGAAEAAGEQAAGELAAALETEASLRQDLQAADERQRKLEEEVQKLNREVQLRARAAEAAEAQLSERIVGLEGALGRSETERKDFELEAREGRERAEALGRDLRELKLGRDRLQSELTESRNDLVRLRQHLETKEAELLARLEESRRQAAEARSEAVKQSATLDASRQEFEADRARAAAEIAELQRSLAERRSLWRSGWRAPATLAGFLVAGLAIGAGIGSWRAGPAAPVVEPPAAAPEAAAGTEPPPEPAPPSPVEARSARPAAERTDLEWTISELQARTLAWAVAWSEQRSQDYLSFYSAGFEPPGGVSRGVWEAQRRARIESPGWIRVKLSDLDVVPSGRERATVRFLQTYESDSFRDQVRKRLELAWENGQWKIVAEAAE